jgi:hypothetical protein
MMHGAMSPQMKSTIMTAVNTLAAADTIGRVRAAFT